MSERVARLKRRVNGCARTRRQDEMFSEKNYPLGEIFDTSKEQF